MDVRSKDFAEWDRHKHIYAKDKIVKNVVHDEKKQLISFNIEVDHEYFRRQLLPFYTLAIELYEYQIWWAGELRDIMSSAASKANSPDFKGGALYHSQFELFKLTASHPTYVECCYKRLSNGRFEERIYNFYHHEGGAIVARLYVKIIRLTGQQLQKVRLKRLNKTQKWKQNYIEPTDKQFDFALPHMVGHNSKKLVFLSNLKENDNNLYCNGLNTMDKNFTFHPFHGGSGDHVNSGGIEDILYQFSHLIVRNSIKFEYLKNKIVRKYGKDFDVNTSVTVGWFDIKYKNSLELNIVYMVKLLSLECIDDMKYPFVFKVRSKIIQHNIETTDIMFKIYPVFSRSHL